MSVMAGKAAIIPYSISNTVFSFVEKEKSTIIFLPIGFTGNNARYGQWIVISSTTMIYIYAPDSATIMRAWITYNAGQTWTPYLKMLEYLESKDYSDSPSTAQNMYKSEIIGQFQTADTEDYAYSVYELDAAYLCVLRYAKKTDTWSHSIVLNDGGGAYYISVIAHDNYVSFVTTNVYVNPNQLRIYTSTDYGASFTLKLSNAGFVNPLAASRSGTRLLFLTINQGVGFFSPDNGATWQQTQAKLKPSVFPKYLAATDEYFIGAFQEDNTSKYMYSYDGMQWFYNPANFSLADIVGYYAYGRLEVTNLVAIDNTIMAMASDVYYSIGDTLPNGVSNQYPFLIELDGFWKDFQNCGEL